MCGAGLWYMWYMGKRTSVYLSDELAAGVAASEAGLAELVRRGLRSDAELVREVIAEVVPPSPPPLEVAGEAIVAIERAPRKPRARKPAEDRPVVVPGCKHEHAVKGWCKDCRSGGHF